MVEHRHGVAMGAVETITHHSAKARCHRKHGSELLHIHYLGVVDQAAFNAITPRVLLLAKTGATFTRLDTALTMFPHEIAAPHHVHGARIGPGVLIVRMDQEQQAARYCGLLATRGIVRQPFLAHQTELAHRWLSLQEDQQKLFSRIRGE